MCKAIDDMMEKREQKGKLEGKQEILMELLKDKDTIEWVYTCDLGKDVGDNYQAKGKKQMEKAKESDKSANHAVEKEDEEK